MLTRWYYRIRYWGNPLNWCRNFRCWIAWASRRPNWHTSLLPPYREHCSWCFREKGMGRWDREDLPEEL